MLDLKEEVLLREGASAGDTVGAVENAGNGILETDHSRR